MAQQGRPLEEILPSIDTGTDLAGDLNEWALYLASTRRNSVPPNEKAEGTVWYRDLEDNRALMLTTAVGADGTGLTDIVLFPIMEPGAGGGKIYEGVEIHVSPAGVSPAAPGHGDLWLIPGGVNDGDDSYTNWQARIYNQTAWETFVDVGNANLLVSTTLGQEPALGELERHYGLMWMDTDRGATTVANNNGLMVWNGSAYVPSWPVKNGETMLKVTTATGEGEPIIPPDVGLAQIRSGVSPSQYWFATGAEWIDLTDKIEFVTDSEEAVSDETGKAMSPFWTNFSVDSYRNANVVQVFSDQRWGDLVETIGAGGNIGKIDPSLTIATGLGYQSTFTATGSTVETEYPLPPNQKGDYYIYLNDPSWTFTSGDLSGQTINKGEGIVLNSAGDWEIVDVILNTDLFVHRDGSLSVYQPLAFTNPSGGDIMNLDYKSILFAAGVLFTIAPTAVQAGGLRVADSGYVGAGNITPTAPLEAHGVAADDPGTGNNIFKASSDNLAYEWLGLRYSRTLNTWNFDVDNATSAVNALSINRSNSYVGLGVDDPQAHLDVAGGALLGGSLQLTAGGIIVDTGDLTLSTGSATVAGDLTALGTSTLGDNPTDDSLSVVQINGPLMMNAPLSAGNLGAPIRMIDGEWKTAGVVNCRYRRMPDGTVVLETTGDPSGSLPGGYQPEIALSFIALGNEDSDFAELNISTEGLLTTGKSFSTRSVQQFRFIPYLPYF